MLGRARGLLALAASHEPHALQAFVAKCSTINRSVAEANQEIDDFFGVSSSARVPNLRDARDTAASSHYPLAAAAPDGDTSGSGGLYGVEPAIGFGGGGGGAATAGSSDIARRQAPGCHGGDAVGASSLRGSRQEDDGDAVRYQQQQQLQRRLTHIDASGSASMVDVSQKSVTVREAQASCIVALGEAFGPVAANSVAKGDVLKVAQLAGICGAKATASLIPLCHNIPISKVDVQLHLDEASRSVVVRALARTDGKTGVEMEALTAASVAALTVYDMCKAAAKDMVVGQLQLDYKSGGRSGTYLRAGMQRSDLLPSARPPL